MNLDKFNKKTQKQLRNYYAKPPQLLKKPLEKNEPIAYISSPNLGDTLIGLVTVNNLLRNGFNVDVFSDYAYSLRDWFPSMSIFPSISLEEQKKLEKYHTVLHMHERPISQAIESWHPHSIVFHHEPLFRLLMSEVDLQLIVCQVQLGLKDLVRNNNIQPPVGLVPHKYQQRVMLHPTSSDILKNWPAKKFVKLAKILQQRGFEPQFIVAPNERAEWEQIIYENESFEKNILPKFATLSDVAAALYESKCFIGNDSGIGHLASNVGLPTISIMIRKNMAIHWRPTFSPGEIILPPFWLTPRFIREKFWKRCTSVNKVLKMFDKITS